MKPYKFKFKSGQTLVARPIYVTKYAVFVLQDTKTFLVSRDALVPESKYAIKVAKDQRGIKDPFDNVSENKQEEC